LRTTGILTMPAFALWRCFHRKMCSFGRWLTRFLGCHWAHMWFLESASTVHSFLRKRDWWGRDYFLVSFQLSSNNERMMFCWMRSHTSRGSALRKSSWVWIYCCSYARYLNSESCAIRWKAAQFLLSQ
jgi:hypothetical protein